MTSEDSLLHNLPSEDEVIDSLESKYAQEEQLEEKEDQTQDYLDLFDYGIRHTFIFEFTQSEWDGLNQDMWDYYDDYGTFKSNNYRKINVTYIKDDEILEIKDVGIRSKGNIYSRFPPEDEYGNVQAIHYMLKFNETFDLPIGSDEYDELKKREVFDLEQVLFKRNNQGDPSYTNEVYSYELFRQAGVVVPRAGFAEVQIVVDGEVKNRSLYNIFEHFDEEFIRKNFDNTKQVGDLFKGSWSATLDRIQDSDLYGVRNWEENYRPVYSKETNKTVDDYTNLIEFSYGINTPNKITRLVYLEENFDCDSFIKAMAINVLLGNPDDYRGNGNNFYYYFDLNNYMTYLPFDYDNSMGNGWNGEPAFIDYTLGNDIYEWGHFDWNNFGIPLWDNLIVYEEYQIKYENYLMEYINTGLFSEEAYLDIYNRVEELYGEDFPMYYDKEYYITTKIAEVTEDVTYYRSQR